MLKVQWPLLQFRMHLSIDENSCIEVLLSIVAKPFIFSENSLEHLVNRLEIFVTRILVPIDLIFHGTVIGGSRDATHQVKEVGTIMSDLESGVVEVALTRRSCKH